MILVGAEWNLGFRAGISSHVSDFDSPTCHESRTSACWKERTGFASSIELLRQMRCEFAMVRGAEGIAIAHLSSSRVIVPHVDCCGGRTDRCYLRAAARLHEKPASDSYLSIVSFTWIRPHDGVGRQAFKEASRLVPSATCTRPGPSRPLRSRTILVASSFESRRRVSYPTNPAFLRHAAVWRSRQHLSSWKNIAALLHVDLVSNQRSEVRHRPRREIDRSHRDLRIISIHRSRSFDLESGSSVQAVWWMRTTDAWTRNCDARVEVLGRPHARARSHGGGEGTGRLGRRANLPSAAPPSAGTATGDVAVRESKNGSAGRGFSARTFAATWTSDAREKVARSSQRFRKRGQRMLREMLGPERQRTGGRRWH